MTVLLQLLHLCIFSGEVGSQLLIGSFLPCVQMYETECYLQAPVFQGSTMNLSTKTLKCSLLFPTLPTYSQPPNKPSD